MYRDPANERVAGPETLAGVELLRRLAAGGREGPAGGRRGRLPGAGEEFYGHRPYYAGDDLRRVDWHAYERTGHAYVKEMVRGIEGRLAVVVDGSASMCFGEPTRFTVARRAALMLAGSVSEGVDVQVIVAGESDKTYRGKKLEEMAAFLEGVRADAPGRRGEGIIRKHIELMYGRGLAVFLGDFYGEAEEVAKGGKFTLGRPPSATGVAVRLLTEADIVPPEGGEVAFVGVEGDGKKFAAWGPKQVAAYRREWERVSEALTKELAAAGVRFVVVPSAKGAVETALAALAAGGYASR